MEKPFGRDLESAHSLNDVVQGKEFQSYLDQVLGDDDRRKFDMATLALVAKLENGHTRFLDKWLMGNFGGPLRHRPSMQLRNTSNPRSSSSMVRGNGGGSTPQGLLAKLMEKPHHIWRESTPDHIGIFRAWGAERGGTILVGDLHPNSVANR